jgi:hypothetical protein
MKKLILVALLAAMLSGLVWPQQTRHEVVNASRLPADDSKPNSDAVPDVYAISGKFDRVLVMRFKFDTDLLAGIEKMVKQEKIRNAVILAAAGSVRGYQVHQVSNRTFPSKNMYEKDPTAPADLISMSVFTFAIVTLGVFDNSVDLSRMDDKAYR